MNYKTAFIYGKYFITMCPMLDQPLVIISHNTSISHIILLSVILKKWGLESLSPWEI